LGQFPADSSLVLQYMSPHVRVRCNQSGCDGGTLPLSVMSVSLPVSSAPGRSWPARRWIPYSTGVALATIATAWPAAGFGALVIWTAGNLAATGTLWIFGWPFVCLLLAATTLHLLAMGLGTRWGIPALFPGITALNRTVDAEDAGLAPAPVLLEPALHAVVRLPVVNAGLGGFLALLVTAISCALEWVVAGSLTPNVPVIARSGIFVSVLYVAASLSLGELLVRPCCRRLRHRAAEIGAEPYDGFALPRGWRVGVAVVPVIIALLVAAEIGTAAHRGAGSYVALIFLTGVIALALGWLQYQNGSAALREFADACRELATGREVQLLTGSVDGTLLRMAQEFNLAARSVGADRRASGEALGRLVRRLEELYRLALLLSDNSTEAAEHVVRALPELLDVPIATVETLDGEEMVVVAMMEDGEIRHGVRFPLAGTPCADVRRDRQHCIFQDAFLRFPSDPYLHEHGIRTYAGVPIIDSRGDVQGVVNVLDRRARSFRGEDVQLLYSFARRVGSALDEERFAREREALTARLAEQVAALSAAQERLLENDRLKTEFVGMMSHELRTPLNIFLGYTQMLLDAASGGQPVTNAEHREILKRMLTAGHTLSDLVEDTLSVLRLEAGAVHLNLEKVDLGDLFAELASNGPRLDSQPPVREHWEAEAGVPILRTDRRKLRQIITNLVGNARKFTSDGRIDVIGEAAGPERVRIRITDTGCGISPEHLPFIFDLYRQAPHGQAHEGCGLGLYIVRRYVEMLQGRVECRSAPGQGTMFTVELPRTLDGPAAEPDVAKRLGRVSGDSTLLRGDPVME
jgi:signal transduction histidine kinase